MLHNYIIGYLDRHGCENVEDLEGYAEEPVLVFLELVLPLFLGVSQRIWVFFFSLFSSFVLSFLFQLFP